ncbi:DUF397 domain-containing protein [Sinosporangium siamense]|uniref:DUF397 domain-containing protein n=1 Tax=Sinosporangium siamense TaxID=1367973 RepID=A0A919RK16_9ACTN|nr:DUF397 domain-containing protein [Sinosporangium siamense]GII93339.1 hypothetical protein Ssi02_35700 [Sinosporangium siamense]
MNLDISRAEWRISSLSGANGQCVAVAFMENHILVRHSKEADGSVLVFTPGEWQAFTGGVRLGEFDLPA